MKRAAILLPGQVRTYSQAYGDFMNFLVNPNKAEWEIDIFLAFQKFTYSCNEKNSGSPHLFAINENDVVSKFNPTKFKIYTIPDDLFRDDYLKIENKIFLPKEYPLVFGNLFGNERQFYPFIYNGVMAQHYGWKQALSLLTGETTYDIVVKTRFDVVPTAPVYFSKIEPSIVSHCDYRNGQYKMDDLIFMSGQENMIKIMKIYDSLIVDGLMPPGRPGMQQVTFPENLLFYYIDEVLKLKTRRIGNAKYYR